MHPTASQSLTRAGNGRTEPDKSSHADLRAETRFAVPGDSATLSVLESAAPQIQARILDISKSGIGLTIERYLPKETKVKLQMGAMIVLGRVRYCRLVEGGWCRVGLISDTVVTKRPS
jgi:hypothetical protein